MVQPDPAKIGPIFLNAEWITYNLLTLEGLLCSLLYVPANCRPPMLYHGELTEHVTLSVPTKVDVILISEAAEQVGRFKVLHGYTQRTICNSTKINAPNSSCTSQVITINFYGGGTVLPPLARFCHTIAKSIIMPHSWRKDACKTSTESGAA